MRAHQSGYLRRRYNHQSIKRPSGHSAPGCCHYGSTSRASWSPIVGLASPCSIVPFYVRQAKIVSEIFKMSAPTTTLSLRTHKTRLTTQEAQELDDATPQECACVCERERAERLTERRERERRERITHILRRNTATCLAEGRLWKLLGSWRFLGFRV